MQIRLHARNTFSFLVAAAFFCLGYLIFFKSGDGFPEIDVDLSNIVSYTVLAVEIGGYAVRKIHEENGTQIWCRIFSFWILSDVQVYIDPLDATQEYTEGLTDYVTVMACVVVKDEPIFGAIFRPFSNEIVVGVKGWGVMTSSGGMIIPVNRKDTAKKVVVSRSHAGDVENLVRRSFGEAYEVESAGGSGYKVLRLLNGTAELYIHQTAIKKWDTCAGDAILRSFGGAMLDLDGVPLRYVTLMLKVSGLIASVRTPYMYIKKIVLNEKP
ncbi:unnamed protein product [Angiostrongylus costaricensis]|uniref:inositol-phosphate phosphatase n=1 Tax=Angiostrongylus costaricensis TaxID=334426 RepID=A0A158PE39_ANGCS|nr:unnamed protein product [Angiostrongylus costaricensis]